MVEQPDAMRFFRLDYAGGEQQLFGDGPADLHGQAPRGVDAPVLDGEESKARPLAADANVEAGRQDRAAAEGEAVERADGRLARGGDAPRVFGPERVGRRRRVHLGVFGHLVNVRARRKRALPRAREYDRADGVVPVQLRDGVVYLAEQLSVHRVQHFGTVQLDYADPVLYVQQQVFVAHACRLP